MTTPPINLQGRVVIITGAGKGLGRAFALHMAAAGASLVVNNRWVDRTQPSSADAVVDEIRARGGTAVASYAGVEDPASGETLVKQALDSFGRLDSVVANAGVTEGLGFHKRTVEDFKTIFDINFYGSFYLIHAAWRVLSGQSYGRIVVNSSAAGLHSNPGMAAYSSSKAALIGLVRSLALDGQRRNVLVNALAPYAATTMTAPYLKEGERDLMDPAYAAPLTSWLTSEACDVTGKTFIVGLGRIAAAESVEGPVLALQDDVRASVHKALDHSVNRHFTDANAAFAAFRETPLD